MAKHDNNLIFEAFVKSRQKVISEDSLDSAGGSNNDDQANKAVTGSNLSDDHSKPEYKVDGPKEEKREVAIGKEILNHTEQLSEMLNAGPSADHSTLLGEIEKLATELIQMHEKSE